MLAALKPHSIGRASTSALGALRRLAAAPHCPGGGDAALGAGERRRAMQHLGRGCEPPCAHAPLLEAPPDLVRAATPGELEVLMPSSYPIARFRRRSIEARGVCVSYKTHPGEALGAPRGAGGAAGNSDAEPPARAPSDSYLEVLLPFASSPNLRDEYERFKMGRVRLGLVLEDIDSLAADIAARHLAGSSQGIAVITACMDKLQLVTHEQHLEQLRLAGEAAAAAAHAGAGADAADASAPDGAAAAGLRPPSPPPSLGPAGRRELQRAVVEGPPGGGGDRALGGPLLIDNDLRVAGCVTWVGRSSLEVTIELADREPPADGGAPAEGGDRGRAGGWRRRGLAHFVMVVRSTEPGVAVRLNALRPATPREELLCAAAAARQEQRTARRQADAAAARVPADGSATVATGAGSDAALLVALAARAQQHASDQWVRRDQASQGGAAAAGAVPMASTCLRSPVVMHHQDRNVTDAVFGGHILRSAYEAAYAAAALHCGCHPEPLSMSDITFKQPVTVGSIVEFDATVVLTHGDLMRVTVAALKHEPAMTATSGPPGRAHQALTTTFSFLFAAPPGAAVVPVRPDSLADAAAWLLAARQHADDGYPAPPIAPWG